MTPHRLFRLSHTRAHKFRKQAGNRRCISEEIEMYFGRHLVDWLQVAAKRWIDWREFDAIEPVPLHPRKQRHREFNQAEYLADKLGKTLNIPVIKRSLRRV